MCPTGPKGAASVLVTEKDMDLLEEKGWKIIAGWLMSPQTQSGMELYSKIGVKGSVGPS
jgi:hypothetical protein